MPHRRGTILRWLPALLWMVFIFAASATPSRELPQFGTWDLLVKKSGHMLGYALLALLYSWALPGVAWQRRAAWALALTYALVDEFHQSFVPGRHPSLIDAFLFDGGGAALALCLSWLLARSGWLSASDGLDRQ